MPTGARRGNRKTVIAFEDLHGKGPPAGPLPAGYAGFTWCENAWFLAKGYLSMVYTGRRVALFNAHGRDISFDRERPFDLTGLSLSSMWENNALVLVEGWEKGSSRYGCELTIHRNAVARPELYFRGIDRVRLSAGGAHFIIEDISVILRET